jgi:hypothetical protein
MTQPEEDAALRLQLVSAKARQLAQDLERGRLWDGELARGLREINEQLERIQVPPGR